MYESVRCSRCGHSYPSVSQETVGTDRPDLCEECRGALFAPSSGEAAQKAVFPAIQANAWLLFNGGKAKVSPDTVGIPKP